jgi:hypothetical protein
MLSKDRFKWHATALEGSDLNALPQMETDVTLRSRERTIIVECKYADSLFQNRFFSEKLRSAHLYQLTTYLRNSNERHHRTHLPKAFYSTQRRAFRSTWYTNFRDIGCVFEQSIPIGVGTILNGNCLSS